MIVIKKSRSQNSEVQITEERCRTCLPHIHCGDAESMHN
jgi:hypothetical protein